MPTMIDLIIAQPAFSPITLTKRIVNQKKYSVKIALTDSNNSTRRAPLESIRRTYIRS